MKVNIYTDGGSRGNPGISGYGVVVADAFGKTIHQEAKFLGIKTNNEAEYIGFIAALNWLKNHHSQLKIDSIDFFSDSQLIIRQIKGQYKVKAKNLLPLFNSAKSLIVQIDLPIQFQDIRRHHNQLADTLANQAMDDHS